MTGSWQPWKSRRSSDYGLELARRDALRAYIRTQNFRNQNAAIRLLIVLDNRNPGASDGKSAAVQGVHQLALAGAFRAIADVGATRLESLEVGARRNFAEQSLPRQPHFDVVSFGRRKSHVSGAQDHGAIVQAELLQDLLGVASELVVLFVRLLGLGELHQLDLLELVLADDAAHVLAIRTGFAAEARRISSQRDGQPRAVERFVAIEIGYRNLGSRNQVEVLFVERNFEQIGFELGELAGAVHRLGIDHKRRQDFGVAMLASVQVEHEIDQRAFELGAQDPIHGETGARDLGSTFEVEDAEFFAEFPMWLGSEVELRRCSPTADFDIAVGILANGHAGIRQIGNSG